jgi:hypothetical protein
VSALDVVSWPARKIVITSSFNCKSGKSIEANLQEKDREIEELRLNDKVKEDALATLSDQVMKLMVEVQELKRRK